MRKGRAQSSCISNKITPRTGVHAMRNSTPDVAQLERGHRRKIIRLKEELENREGFDHEGQAVSPFLTFMAKTEILKMHSSIFPPCYPFSKYRSACRQPGSNICVQGQLCEGGFWGDAQSIGKTSRRILVAKWKV